MKDRLDVASAIAFFALLVFAAWLFVGGLICLCRHGGATFKGAMSFGAAVTEVEMRQESVDLYRRMLQQAEIELEAAKKREAIK